MPDQTEDLWPATFKTLVDDPAPAVLLEGLGGFHRPISTASAEAQRWFDQGLALAYGFNAGEAVRSFQEAAALDPSCVAVTSEVDALGAAGNVARIWLEIGPHAATASSTSNHKNPRIAYLLSGSAKYIDYAMSIDEIGRRRVPAAEPPVRLSMRP